MAETKQTLLQMLKEDGYTTANVAYNKAAELEKSSAAIEELARAAEEDIECCDYCASLGYICKVHLKTALALSDYKAVKNV